MSVIFMYKKWMNVQCFNTTLEFSYHLWYASWNMLKVNNMLSFILTQNIFFFKSSHHWNMRHHSQSKTFVINLDALSRKFLLIFSNAREIFFLENFNECEFSETLRDNMNMLFFSFLLTFCMKILISKIRNITSKMRYL